MICAIVVSTAEVIVDIAEAATSRSHLLPESVHGLGSIVLVMSWLAFGLAWIRGCVLDHIDSLAARISDYGDERATNARVDTMSRLDSGRGVERGRMTLVDP
jgi:hypothetical protein